MMHIRSRRILAAVSAAMLLFTSVPSCALAEEYTDEEALLSMEEAAPVAEEQEEFDQQTELPENLEADVPGDMDVFDPESEEQFEEDEEVIQIDEFLLNEDEEDPEMMIVPDGIPEEDEEQILPDVEEYIEAAESSDQVILEVAGVTDSLTVPIGKGFPVVLRADSPIESIRVDAGDHWWYGGDEFGPEDPHDAWFETGNYVMHDSSGGYDEPDTYQFYAQVLLEGSSEWITSNVILITAEQYGETGPFTFSLDTNSVPVGGMVTVNYGEAENADHYWVDIQKWYEADDEHDQAEWDWYDHRGDSDLPGMAGFGTGDMEPGDYRVFASAEGEGYRRAEGTCDGKQYAELTVTPSETGEGAVSLSVDKTNLQTCEDYSFSIYAPGAEWIELAFDYDNLEDWDDGWTDDRNGEFWSERRSYGRRGTYQLVARAHYKDSTGQEWTVLSDPVTVTVTAPNGELSIRLPDGLPSYLMKDSTLAFEMDMPELARDMEIEVWYDKDNRREDLYRWRSWEEGSEHAVVTITPEQLEQAGEGTAVKINVRVTSFGYEEGEDYTEIPIVASAAPDKVRLTIVKPDVVWVNQDVRIKVEAVNSEDTIKAMRIWDDGGYWDWGNEIGRWNHGDWFDSDGNLNVGHSWGNPGRKTIYAEVTFDEYDGGDDQRQWYVTEVETVEVTSRGRVGDFTFNLNKTTARRGDLVQITYEVAENADHYWVDVDRWYEADAEHDRAGWYWYDHYADSRSAGAASLSTADMEPGTYRVFAKAEGDGWEGCDSITGPLELVITESDIPEGTVSLTVDKTNLVTRENFTFSVYAPGADRIQTAFDFDHTDNWRYGWIDDNGGGESWVQSRSYGETGTYTLKARAHYPAGNWVESDPVTITVTSHKGVIAVSLPDDLPSYLTTQNDFSFRAVMPENAEHLSVDVWHDTEDGSDGNLFNDWTDDEPYIDVTIRKEQLAAIGAGGIVRIAVSAEAYDYDGTRVECSIPVIDEPDADRLDIVAEPTEALVNEDVRITVSPKRAEDKIRAVRLFDGEGFWEESRPEWNRDQFDAAGNFSVEESWWEPGVKRVFAQVTFDGNNWLNTDIVEINVRKNGDVGPFTCSIDKGSVVRGELAVATFTKADHADHYWIDIDIKCVDDETGHTWWERRSHKADRIGEPGSVSFGTSDLEPGEYRFMGKAAGIGYQGGDAQNGYCYLTVTDSDTAEGNILVNVSKTQLDTAENFAVSVLAPGAKWVEVFYDYNGEGDWWNRSRFNGGDSFEGQSNYGHSGTYSIVAKAHYFETDAQGNPVNPDEHGNPTDEVTKTSEPVTMTVAASKGEALSITPPVLPAYLSEGDDLSFTVQKPEQSDFVEVRVWYDPDDQETDGLLLEGWISEDSSVVTVPADKLAVVKDGKYVKVRVYANASGYDDAEAFKQIPVVPAVDTEKTVITASKTDPEVNEEITVTVSPKNVGATGKIKAVRFWGGMYYFHRGLDITPGENPESFDADGNFVTGCPIEEPGTYSIFAKVTFDEVSRDGEDNRTWYTTDTIEVNVSSNGFVESKNFSLDKNRAKKDDTVLLTMEPAANVAEYWLEVEKRFEADQEHPEAYWEFVRDYAVEIPADQLGSFPVPVRNMEPGDYRLRVWMYAGKGYQGCYANGGDYEELKIRDPWMTEEEEAAVEELKAIINSLPFTAGAANEAAVARAKEILDSLNDVQKEYLGGDAAVQALANQVNGAQAQVDQAKADAVIAQINNLPEGAGLAQKAAIQAAAAAYAALTPAQKALVDANTAAKKKLKDAQDKVAAETVAAQLNALNANAGLADQVAVAAARKAYNSLTADQKKL
ncbi:MAG: hypothetical protein II640_09570, partial [Lachnospiraceae bacterium]|nr:hypothetical protein [Lachnospiraceae bacterium]